MIRRQTNNKVQSALAIVVLFWLLATTATAKNGVPHTTKPKKQLASASTKKNGKFLLHQPLHSLPHACINKRDSGSKALATSLRAGGSNSAEDAPTARQLAGVLTFVGMEVALRRAFQAAGIDFPAQLAGCVLLFVILLGAQLISPGTGDAWATALSPGATFLTKWMGCFFIPGLTMLPLAPSLGSPWEIVKALGIVVGGFYYSLALVTYSVLGVRKLTGATTGTTATQKQPKSTIHKGNIQKKPYNEATLAFLLKGTTLFGLVRLGLHKVSLFNGKLNKPMESLFFTFATISSYVWGANLPSQFTKVCNPLLTSAFVTLALARTISSFTKASFTDILRSYTCKNLHYSQIGAGDLLLFFLSPCVISFGVGMFKGKTLIAANLPAVATAVLVGALGSMVGTAAAARVLNLGGPHGQVIRLAAVPRSTQTALGMTIAQMLGGNVAIAATLIILTGIFGGMVGVATLNQWGIHDAVSRGLGMGSAGLSLGVVSIQGEPQAFAFAGLCLVLTAVAATSLASVPVIQQTIIKIAGGSVPAAAATMANAY
uniref:Plastidal glycolate/glycerate translocator 1, chloroplastic n=1 Tax=Entomoneis paludosa TaxID=265537 RepID=A0A7S2YDS6_9STRA